MPLDDVLLVKLLRPRARVPWRATPAATGYDLFASLDAPGYVDLGPDVTLVGTGIALQIPLGYDIQIRPRSGLAREGVAALLGTIDSDYRGEIFVSMHTFGTRASHRIENGDRIAQLVLSRAVSLEFEVVTELEPTERGYSGHGSTGR